MTAGDECFTSFMSRRPIRRKRVDKGCKADFKYRLEGRINRLIDKASNDSNFQKRFFCNWSILKVMKSMQLEQDHDFKF